MKYIDYFLHIIIACLMSNHLSLSLEVCLLIPILYKIVCIQYKKEGARINQYDTVTKGIEVNIGG